MGTYPFHNIGVTFIIIISGDPGKAETKLARLQFQHNSGSTWLWSMILDDHRETETETGLWIALYHICNCNCNYCCALSPSLHLKLMLCGHQTAGLAPKSVTRLVALNRNARPLEILVFPLFLKALQKTKAPPFRFPQTAQLRFIGTSLGPHSDLVWKHTRPHWDLIGTSFRPELETIRKS